MEPESAEGGLADWLAVTLCRLYLPGRHFGVEYAGKYQVMQWVSEGSADSGVIPLRRRLLGLRTLTRGKEVVPCHEKHRWSGAVVVARDLGTVQVGLGAFAEDVKGVDT